MAFYNKSDMHYDDYSWTATKGDDPTITGLPDSTMFSRNEGYEVLYLINKLVGIWNLKKKASGTKMEKMIHDHLPSDTRSQKNVKEWIKNNWEKY